MLHHFESTNYFYLINFFPETIRDIFQMLKNTYTKVYKTHVAPIIDWFIPTVFLLRHDPLATANIIEVFQQRMLTMAIGASRLGWP